ncbi:hypothetical protein Bbelb_338090 [Branchiostoma belcheri]|nr:hypothetical protein Bbelb_338090 [Branchiostoma belcheri]
MLESIVKIKRDGHNGSAIESVPSRNARRAPREPLAMTPPFHRLQVTRTWLSQTNTLLCGECSELLHRNMSGVIMSADFATTHWAAVTSGSALSSRTASPGDDSDFDGLPVGLYKSASGTNPPLNPPLSLRNSASMIQKHAGGFGQIVIEYKRSSAKVSRSRL